ncbi:nitrate- and nitrite sensing domain-containing protein [Streptomyces sp. NBC_01551]|uniref:sensor histidine kinase n=1 Tax=Streptomyces sp. NBC_01551 TaxID=2975876 RepID=UPI002252ABD5|nr:nitrate- and nitrite sensing domain-containing protein [Streptomyces sp. NBC_01551]MCX4528053.1 nitrate- and nitrite sensing domain-containing protein [Streptomyces sp. NBC_01551]
MRSRLVVGVAVAGLTVLAAGSPAVVSAMAELNDSQRLVTLAEQTGQTLTLAHLLGDERDAVVEYAAKGRPGAGKAAVQERVARTDRQLAEVRAEADEDLARALGRVQAVRTEAVDGKGTALAAHQAYAGVIADLLAPGDRLAELTPPRAEAALATTRPLAPLGQAVDQASATRGLLLAALAVPRGEQPPGAAVVDELTAAAQRSRVREQAALDDFNRAARPDVRQTLAATVTGPEVKTADDFLGRLTDRPTLSAADRKLDGAAVGSALTARIDRMRSVESTLAGQRATALATLRDDDVTALEALIAGLGVLFLIVVGVSTAVARSLTRPLSVLRRGAERLATPEGSVEPVRFTGRNDEFAEVVRHLNAVRDQTVSLHTRIAGLDADRRRLIGRNEALASGREALEAELKELRTGLEEHRRVMSTTSVSLSLRTLGLVERQLTVIEELESKEQDPDRLATLFKLDHLATVMRRHNENLLVLAGQEHGPGAGGAVPLVDVMRAAVSEIERYERVELAALPSFTQVAGHAADDISHVLAELLENATTFSPPEARVRVSGWLTEAGDAVLSVVDEGIGVTEDRLAALNLRLSTPEAYDEEPESEHGLGLGLYVAGRLAARHGVTAELRVARHGGTEALVVVPAPLLPTTPPASPVHTLATPGAPEWVLPGVIAEANENTLPWGRGAGTPTPTPESRTAATPSADEELLARVVPDAAPAESAEELFAAAPALDGELPSADQVFTASGLEGELPSADQVFTASGAEAVLPSADETFTVPAPEEELLARVVPDAAPAESAQEPFAVDGELPSADQVFTASGAEAVLPSADETFTVPAPEEELLARVVPDAAPAESAQELFAVDGELPSADQVFTVPGPEGELPSADEAFAASGAEAGLPSADETITDSGPEGGLPSADQVFTVPAPEEELLARVVPDAEPAGAGEGFAPAEGDVPAADQVFTVPGPEAEPSAPVVPDAGPEDGAEPAPADAAPADAAQADAAPATESAAPAGYGARGAAPFGQVPEAMRRPVPLHEAEPLSAAADGHGRAADAQGNWLPRQGSHPEEAVTDKGLPKRTPRAVAAPRVDAVRPEPPRRVDAEELRRRLGGFYQGAQDGRRVVAAELAQEHGQDTDQGDTAQEART